LREVQLSRYPTLTVTPPPSKRLEQLLARSPAGSNDWVDDMLIAALDADAVDYLVTQDERLHRKAARVGLDDKTIFLDDAVAMLEALFDVRVAPPPSVAARHVYELDATDPIFDNLRTDYLGFDDWFRGIKTDHERATWVIPGPDHYAAICITKRQQDGEYGISGRTLKLCTLRVAGEYEGNRFGELILKTVFDHAAENSYEWVWVTVFEKHEGLLKLLAAFGFEDVGRRTRLGELVLSKPMAPNGGDLSPLAYNVRYGPREFRVNAVASFLVPIQPVYHRRLFPEAEPQGALLTEPCGNAIRKAYVCRSPTKTVPEGSLLLFYRSHDWMAATAVGVVEDTLRSADPDLVAGFVARRAVYSFEDVRGLCHHGEVLAIRFRLARLFKNAISGNLLIEAGIMSRAPQSMMRLKEEAPEWIARQLK
jgi:L-amino acid N-acyltransferase YncA